jgi:hypothetical protein
MEKKDELDVLMRTYIAFRAEILEFVRLFRAHVNYLSIITTSIVALVSLGGKTDNAFVSSNAWLWLYVSLAITTLVSYLVFNALEAHYAMFATAGCAADLERRINDIADKALLIWESALSDRYWWDPAHKGYWFTAKPIKGVGYPSKYLISYMMVMIFFGVFSGPGYLAYRVCEAPTYSGVVLALISAIYSAVSFIWIMNVAGGVLWGMKDPARKLAGEVADNAQRAFESTHPRSGQPS